MNPDIPGITELPQLPYDIQAEEAVLGAILQDQSKMDSVSEILRFNDFYRVNNREVFSAMEFFYDAGKDIDAINLAEFIKKRNDKDILPYLIDLITNTVGGNAGAYAMIVKDRSVRRMFISISVEISRMAYDISIERNTLVDQIQSAVIQVDNDRNEELDVKTSSDAVKLAVQEMDRRFRLGNVIDGIPFGLERIDNRIKGFKPENFVVIAGRPGMAKTVLALQFALNASVKSDYNGIYFSLEMSTTELNQRAISNISGIPLTTVQEAQDELWAANSASLEAAVGKLRGGKVIYVDCPGMHINQIKKYSRKVHKKNKLNYIVIDHIHIATGEGNTENERVTSISNGLKQLAKELKITVIGVAQLNRDVENRQDKRPVMRDLRGSGSVEQDADIIMFLYREDYYTKDGDSTPNDGLMEVNTAKFRNGVRGSDVIAHELDKARVVNTDRRWINHQKAKRHYSADEL